MNNTQLYLSIGIPSFLVVLAWVTTLTQNSKHADRLDRLGEKVDRQGERLSEQITRMAEQNHRDAMEAIKATVDVHERLTRVEARQG